MSGGSALGLHPAPLEYFLSGYLFQSVCWMALLAPFTLDVDFGSTAYTAALIAVGVWITSVIGAYVMSKRGNRGPAETLLRRLVY